MQKLVLMALMIVLTLPAGAPVVDAHRAVVIGRDGLSRDTAIRLEDADIAWAVFGALPARETQHLTFLRPASGMVRARVLVGTQQSNLRLNPWLALAGPGLPRPPAFDALLPAGEGALLFPPPDDRDVELFEQAFPWPVLVGASFEIALPEANGPFYLLVFDPSGQSGPYVVDTGYLLD